MHEKEMYCETLQSDVVMDMEVPFTLINLYFLIVVLI